MSHTVFTVFGSNMLRSLRLEGDKNRMWAEEKLKMQKGSYFSGSLNKYSCCRHSWKLKLCLYMFYPAPLYANTESYKTWLPRKTFRFMKFFIAWEAIWKWFCITHSLWTVLLLLRFVCMDAETSCKCYKKFMTTKWQGHQMATLDCLSPHFQRWVLSAREIWKGTVVTLGHFLFVPWNLGLFISIWCNVKNTRMLSNNASFIQF